MLPATWLCLRRPILLARDLAVAGYNKSTMLNLLEHLADLSSRVCMCGHRAQPAKLLKHSKQGRLRTGSMTTRFEPKPSRVREHRGTCSLLATRSNALVFSVLSFSPTSEEAPKCRTRSVDGKAAQTEPERQSWDVAIGDDAS